MHKVIIRYIDDSQSEDLFVIHPADEMKAKRQLAGKPYADEEYTYHYLSYLAAVRSGKVAEAVSFERWIETVAEVEPRLTLKEIDAAVLARGVGPSGEVLGITDAQVDYLRAQVREEEAAEGEAAAPRS